MEELINFCKKNIIECKKKVMLADFPNKDILIAELNTHHKYLSILIKLSVKRDFKINDILNEDI